MTLLKILTYPEKSLLQPSVKVDTIDDELKQLTQDMGETMFAAPGVGLAAPQVGRSVCLTVIDATGGEQEPYVLINPETFYFSQEPLWSPNQPKDHIHNYCSKILLQHQIL